MSLQPVFCILAVMYVIPGEILHTHHEFHREGEMTMNEKSLTHDSELDWCVAILVVIWWKVECTCFVVPQGDPRRKPCAGGAV